MKLLVLSIATLFCCLTTFGQSEQLAKDYFDKGDFEKALISYKKLYEQNKGNGNYFFKLIEIHQQLEQLDSSERMLVDRISRSKSPHYLVELGYNYQLKQDSVYANKYYQLAKQGIEEKPVFAYNVAQRFESHALIDDAAEVYERAMELRPESNYHMQLARIYGERGKVEKMFSSYINFVEFNNTYISYAKRAFSEYISENGADENNQILRRVLLKKIQTKPNILWNQLLSWLFIQQRDYNKAFAQERAIHRRHQDMQGVADLAQITIDEGDIETAIEALNYIISNSFDVEARVIGRVESNDGVQIEVKDDKGKYVYDF